MHILIQLLYYYTILHVLGTHTSKSHFSKFFTKWQWTKTNSIDHRTCQHITINILKSWYYIVITYCTSSWVFWETQKEEIRDTSTDWPRTGPLPASSIPSQHGSVFIQSGIVDSITLFFMLSDSNSDIAILICWYQIW